MGARMPAKRSVGQSTDSVAAGVYAVWRDTGEDRRQPRWSTTTLTRRRLGRDPRSCAARTLAKEGQVRSFELAHTAEIATPRCATAASRRHTCEGSCRVGTGLTDRLAALVSLTQDVALINDVRQARGLESKRIFVRLIGSI